MNELQRQKHSEPCLDRGLLISLRDGELTSEETAQAQAHLAVCPDCAADERDVQKTSQEIDKLLAALAPYPQEIPETALAFAALQARINTQDQQAEIARGDQHKISFLHTKKAQRHMSWWIAAAAVMLMLLLVVPNASVLASQFLSLFSVQKFQPVSLDPQSFRNGLGEDLQAFGSVDINSGNFDVIEHPTQAQVAQETNFKLLLPTTLPAGVGQAMQFTLVNSANGTFTFNANSTRAYLAKTGQGNVSIPAQLDGATFTITLAPGVVINYGKQCQQQAQNISRSSSRSVANLGCSGGKPFYIAEIPSPVIRATGKASLEDLRSFLLSLPKLSSGARLLLQNLDLSSGVIPLPIPAQVQAQQVTVHGAQGVMMVDSSLSVGAILWQTHGIIYVAAGQIDNSVQLLDSANSLH